MTTRGRVRLLWTAFTATHVWLALLGLVLRPESTYDVELYRRWAEAAVHVGVWPVLDVPWVYPVGALVPVTVVAPAAASPLGYAMAWFALVTALDGVAVHLLLRTTRHGELAAWWWLVALTALGPVSLGRLDGVVAPLTLVALVLASRRPLAASALLTFAAWIKVAPGAVLIALLATARRPVRTVVLPALVVTGVVAGLALAAGAGPRLVSFLDAQSNRGLQVESVAATPYSLARLFGAPSGPSSTSASTRTRSPEPTRRRSRERLTSPSWLSSSGSGGWPGEPRTAPTGAGSGRALRRKSSSPRRSPSSSRSSSPTRSAPRSSWDGCSHRSRSRSPTPGGPGRGGGGRASSSSSRC